MAVCVCEEGGGERGGLSDLAGWGGDRHSKHLPTCRSNLEHFWKDIKFPLIKLNRGSTTKRGK